MTSSIIIAILILGGGNLGIFTRRKLPPGEPQKWRRIHKIWAQGQLHRDEEQERLEQQYEKSHLSCKGSKTLIHNFPSQQRKNGKDKNPKS